MRTCVDGLAMLLRSAILFYRCIYHPSEPPAPECFLAVLPKPGRQIELHLVLTQSVANSGANIGSQPCSVKICRQSGKNLLILWRPAPGVSPVGLSQPDRSERAIDNPIHSKDVRATPCMMRRHTTEENGVPRRTTAGGPVPTAPQAMECPSKLNRSSNRQSLADIFNLVFGPRFHKRSGQQQVSWVIRFEPCNARASNTKNSACCQIVNCQIQARQCPAL